MSLMHIDASALADLAKRVAALKVGDPGQLDKAVNKAGGAAVAAMASAFTRQTSLQPKVIRRAMHIRPSAGGAARFVVDVKGGDIALKYFAHEEAGSGVNATVKGAQVFVERGFTKGGGGFGGSRVDLHMGGQVFQRHGGGHKTVKFKKVHSGVLIPEEFTRAQTKSAFESVSLRVLGQVLAAPFGARP